MFGLFASGGLGGVVSLLAYLSAKKPAHTLSQDLWPVSYARIAVGQNGKMFGSCIYSMSDWGLGFFFLYVSCLFYCVKTAHIAARFLWLIYPDCLSAFGGILLTVLFSASGCA